MCLARFEAELMPSDFSSVGTRLCSCYSCVRQVMYDEVMMRDH